MRNTPPEPPVEQRETPELVEDLCLALRDVGARDYGLPEDERGIATIKCVQQIHAELEARDVDCRARITQLTEQTNWQMEPLLQECLSYPQAIPYVRDLDGVRRAFRCYICQQQEFPDRKGLLLCDTCLEQSAESIRNRIPLRGLLLLRLYNESYWCRHANADTVMSAFDDYETLGYAWCAACITEEKERRVKLG